MERLKPSPANILRLIEERPRVVATLMGPADIVSQARKAQKDGADILELRIDSLNLRDRGRVSDLINQLKKSVRLPILVTVRDPREQGPASNASGLARLKDAERLRLYQEALPHADLIDVEIRSSIATPLLKLAKKSKVPAILSYHDFAGFPTEARLRQLAARFRQLKGDILKVAARPSDRVGVLRFMLSCLATGLDRKCFIAMGETGKISRFAGFCFGSCLTYGFISRSAAPGQVPVRDLARIYKNLRPAHRSVHRSVHRRAKKS